MFDLAVTGHGDVALRGEAFDSFGNRGRGQLQALDDARLDDALLLFLELEDRFEILLRAGRQHA